MSFMFRCKQTTRVFEIILIRETITALFVLDYGKLFEYLNSLKGPVDMQITVINDAVNEAMRFKRKNLAESLQDFAEKIVTRKENLHPNILKNGHR